MVNLMNTTGAPVPPFGMYVVVLYSGAVPRRDPDGIDMDGVRWGVAKLMATREESPAENSGGPVRKSSRLVWQDDGGRQYAYHDVAAWVMLPRAQQEGGYTKRYSFIVPNGPKCHRCFAYECQNDGYGAMRWCKFFGVGLTGAGYPSSDGEDVYKCQQCKDTSGNG